MQTIYDLTNEEVNKLTDAQVERFIDIECAKKGIMLLPDRPDEPGLEKPETDFTIYEVGDFKFATPEDANTILEALNKCHLVRITYDYKVGYDYHYVCDGSDESPVVKTKKVYSKDKFNLIKNLLSSYANDKSKYEKEKKEYDEAIKLRSNVYREVWDFVNDIRERHYQKELLKKNYLRYLDLAEGNYDTAMTFFEATYKDQLEDIDNVDQFKQELKNIVPIQNSNEENCTKWVGGKSDTIEVRI